MTKEELLDQIYEKLSDQYRFMDQESIIEQLMEYEMWKISKQKKSELEDFLNQLKSMS